MKRGKTWLAAGGLVIDSKNRWLVVKKSYGGLQGQWSLPAGFVDAGETADAAAVREVKEETGIETTVAGVAGIRTGVIEGSISDTMIVFHLALAGTEEIAVHTGELLDARWLEADKLKSSTETSELVRQMVDLFPRDPLLNRGFRDPGVRFGYTDYRFFG